MQTASVLPLVAAFCLGLPLAALAAESAPAAKPVVSYIGSEFPDTSADGALRLIVGVQNIQVVRANRTAPEHQDKLAHTYLHAPMLAWWKGKFYLEYLSSARNESEAPCSTSLTTSTDGMAWETPRTIFPSIKLRDGAETITHQRMGFFVAPNGRLLALAFYGKAPEPNDGTGVGRAVREIHEDGSLGPVYMIRYNLHAGWKDGDTPYPMYTTSPDSGFVDSCKSLLGNRLMTLQWWEEDRSPDGFYSAIGKAFAFYHRDDGSVVGLWKDGLSALSTDGGNTWTTKAQGTRMPINASKYWGQRVAPGHFALFLNPTNRLRHPLAVMLSKDGLVYDGLYTVFGELPDQRFPGAFKNLGPQYTRGIVEGNGTPPDGAIWLTHSVNKEDIWVARVPAALSSRVDAPVNDNFDDAPISSLPADWNIYSPRWAPVRVVDAGGSAGRALELRDEDPYDYARAIRVFPETHGVKVSFKILARQVNARLEIDLQSGHGERPIRLAFGEDGHLRGCHEGIWQDAGPYTADQWIRFELEIPKTATADRCEVKVNGHAAFSRPLVFTDPAKTVERLSFRSGAYRYRGNAGTDLPGADQRVPASSFLVDEVVVTPQ
jgi:hypothetical protein